MLVLNLNHVSKRGPCQWHAQFLFITHRLFVTNFRGCAYSGHLVKNNDTLSFTSRDVCNIVIIRSYELISILKTIIQIIVCNFLSGFLWDVMNIFGRKHVLIINIYTYGSQIIIWNAQRMMCNVAINNPGPFYLRSEGYGQAITFT